MKVKVFTTLALLLATLSHSALAKVSQQQANKLGTELSNIGAQILANEDGTIPKYQGGLKSDINADPFINIYAHETPLFTITANNYLQYTDKLSNGQVALFKKYPDTYQMPIYATHRTASFPKAVYEKAKKNVTTTELVSGGNGLSSFDETVPFAIPNNGLEVIWNHVSRYRGGSVMKNFAQIAVQENGDYTPVKIRGLLSPPQYLADGYDANIDDNVLFYYVQQTKSPARFTGDVLLVHETIDQVSQPRMAWSYNAGQRRVRRAPQLAYDAPGQAVDGLRTSDQLDMFNGAPDRYDWNLVGKKEIYIPYNSYKLADKNAKYQDIVQAGHINPNYSRYELHRVWQVEATLKSGARHIYKKRTFYVDEDSWQVALADNYDGHGQLWRVSEGHALQFVNANAPWYIASTYYDLNSSRYIVELNSEERNAFIFNNPIRHKNFTASAIRRMGKR